MPALDAFRAEVEKKVQEKLVPAILDRAIKVHRKREWRHCDCNVCRLKRIWHDRLQFAPRFPGIGERRLAVENWRWFSTRRASQELDQACEVIISPE